MDSCRRHRYTHRMRRIRCRCSCSYSVGLEGGILRLKSAPQQGGVLQRNWDRTGVRGSVQTMGEQLLGKIWYLHWVRIGFWDLELQRNNVDQKRSASCRCEFGVEGHRY